MSPTKKDRKIRSYPGRNIPEEDIKGPLGSNRFAELVAEALRREFSENRSSIKTVVRLTHANERAVKNWFLAKNAPRGPHLISLMRHSDEILETFLVLAGRRELLAAMRIVEAKHKIKELQQLFNELSS